MGSLMEQSILLVVKLHAETHSLSACAQYVLRHPGRGSADDWAVHGSWTADDSPGPAETLYEATKAAMRQGGIALVRDGVVERLYTAPRLRTKW